MNFQIHFFKKKYSKHETLKYIARATPYVESLFNLQGGEQLPKVCLSLWPNEIEALSEVITNVQSELDGCRQSSAVHVHLYAAFEIIQKYVNVEWFPTIEQAFLQPCWEHTQQFLIDFYCILFYHVPNLEENLEKVEESLSEQMKKINLETLKLVRKEAIRPYSHLMAI